VAKRLEIGDEIYVWDNPEKVEEFKRRTEEAREEIKEKGRIVFYVAKSYKFHYKRRPSFLYKQTVTGFKPLEMGGAPKYKDHYINFKEVLFNDGRRMARFITSNPEEVAFLDMKQGIVREEERELSPYEIQILEKKKLEQRVAELEARLSKNKESEEIKKEIKQEKKRGRPKRKESDN